MNLLYKLHVIGQFLAGNSLNFRRDFKEEKFVFCVLVEELRALHFQGTTLWQLWTVADSADIPTPTSVPHSTVRQDFWLQLNSSAAAGSLVNNRLLNNKYRPRIPSSANCLYRRGWGWLCRGKEEEGLEDDEGEQGDMEAREAVATASSASSSSPPPPWSSWLTLDCKAAGVSHSLGRQLWRNGTQELK